MLSTSELKKLLAEHKEAALAAYKEKAAGLACFYCQRDGLPNKYGYHVGQYSWDGKSVTRYMQPCDGNKFREIE